MPLKIFRQGRQEGVELKNVQSHPKFQKFISQKLVVRFLRNFAGYLGTGLTTLCASLKNYPLWFREFHLCSFSTKKKSEKVAMFTRRFASLQLLISFHWGSADWWRVRLSRVPFSSLDPLPTFIQCALVNITSTVHDTSSSRLRWWHLTALADSVQLILSQRVRTSKDRCRSRQATIVLIIQCLWTGPRSSHVSAPMLWDTASPQV